MSVRPEKYIPSNYVRIERVVKKCGECGCRIRGTHHQTRAKAK
jgi:hypothetical protein